MQEQHSVVISCAQKDDRAAESQLRPPNTREHSA